MGINFGNSAKFYTTASDSVMNSAVKISVIGVGGAGGNIVKYLLEKKLPNVNLICANTDMQAMMETSVSSIIQLGKNTTRGLGAGSNPEIGEKSAIEASEEIKAALHGTDMLILVSGLGGGTGTGATPVISNIAREMGILTLTFAVTPFDFELERKKLCEYGINNLIKSTDSIITLSNQKLLSLYNDNLTFIDALTMVNDIVYQGIMGVVNLLLKKELINRDFSDIVQVMKNKGHSIISVGRARGEGRAVAATTEALTNPLLSDVSIKGATGMIITICAAQNSLKLSEVNDVMNAILSETNADTAKPNILFGTSFIDDLEDEIQVSIIATGLKSSNVLQNDNINNINEPIEILNESDEKEKSQNDNLTDMIFSENISDFDNKLIDDLGFQESNDVVLEDVKEDNQKNLNIDNVNDSANIQDNLIKENKSGFFSEFFSKSKSFDNLGEYFIKDNVDFYDDKLKNSESESFEDLKLSDSNEDCHISFLSDDTSNKDDDFFSDIEEINDEKIEVDNKLFDTLNSEKDDNILFLTEKQNNKKHEKFYSKQVDIFELIDSITASK